MVFFGRDVSVLRAWAAWSFRDQPHALAVLLILAGIVIVRRNEQRLADEADRALPGPLDTYRLRGTRP